MKRLRSWLFDEICQLCIFSEILLRCAAGEFFKVLDKMGLVIKTRFVKNFGPIDLLFSYEQTTHVTYSANSGVIFWAQSHLLKKPSFKCPSTHATFLHELMYMEHAPLFNDGIGCRINIVRLG